jgi:hypothetical protein
LEKHNIGGDGQPLGESDQREAKHPANPTFIQGGKLQKMLFKRFLLEWMIAAHIAFLQIENPHFRRFLCFLNSAVERVLPASSNTIRAWIDKMYDVQRAEISRLLHQSPHLIHFSFDAWSSPNNLPLLGVVVHWIDEEGQKHNALVGLRTIEGEHSGENMAGEVWKIIKELGITHKVGYFVLDNATTNCTTLRSLQVDLHAAGLSQFKATDRRLRCMGHIINLIVKKILFGTAVDVEIGEDAVDRAAEADEINKEKQRIKEWRAKGPMGKLHNIVTHIRRSPQRMAAFLKLQSQTSMDNANGLVQLQAVADNATRWNSAYSMLERAIQLQIYLDMYVTGAESGSDLQEDALSTSEWKFLRLMHDLLQPFQQHTKEMEGHGKDGKRAVLADAIPTLDMLRAHLLRQYAEHQDRADISEASRILCTAINNGLDHLEKYHALLTKTPVYLAAIALNPVSKLSYFRTHQSVSQAAKSKKEVRQLWESEYRINNELYVEANTASDNSTLIDKWYRQAESMMDEPGSAAPSSTPRPRTTRTSQRAQPSTLDELDRWLLEPAEIPGKLSNVIAYWRAKSGSYPQLSHMALDLLSIPPTSCEAERVFSRYFSSSHCRAIMLTSTV